MTVKTDKTALTALYDALAVEMKKQLAEGGVPAASLNVIRQFLKDAGISSPPGAHDVVNDIANSLPFAGEEYDSDHTVN